MKNLSFKSFVEMANYGRDISGPSSKILGGTEEMPGERVFNAFAPSKLISELSRLPIGDIDPNKVWENTVEWGDQAGAIQVETTIYGSLKIMVRRKIFDLLGEQTWICKHVRPISDVHDENHEVYLAQEIHRGISKLNHMGIEPASQMEDFDKFSKKLWIALNKKHPSYCMFPTKFVKVNENYSKLVFEFRGAGNGSTSGSLLLQFDIDLNFEKEKGLLRCWGYNISSPFKKCQWEIEPSEWDERFSPKQPFEEIIECISQIFMQY